MTEEIFNKITDINSSWAIWPEADWSLIDKDFYLKNLNVLKPNVIFLGLNQSNAGQIQSNDIKPFSNFHTPNHRGDNVLNKLIVLNNNLAGGFMTDISDKKDSNSNNVHVNSNNVESFISKLLVFNEKKITIICFGDKVYNSLKSNLDVDKEINFIKFNLLMFSKEINNSIIIDVYRVWHYSNYGKFQSKINELETQLNFINSQNK